VAYYTALINEWAAVTSANPAWTTQQKLNYINSLTVSGLIPTTLSVTGNQILNCINWTEFSALTAAQQSNILSLCNVQGNLLGGSANASFMVDGMILGYFTNHTGPTITALSALAQATVQPWYIANGYSSAFNNNDLVAAGGLV